MAVYKYTAKDINAKRITGKMEVNSRSELAAFLRSRDQYLIDCKDVTNTQQNTYKLTLKELSDFSRQLGAMIGSGVSLIRAVSILVNRKSKVFIRICTVSCSRDKHCQWLWNLKERRFRSL